VFTGQAKHCELLGGAYEPAWQREQTSDAPVDPDELYPPLHVQVEAPAKLIEIREYIYLNMCRKIN
jgi:hypothetical protein